MLRQWRHRKETGRKQKKVPRSLCLPPANTPAPWTTSEKATWNWEAMAAPDEMPDTVTDPGAILPWKLPAMRFIHPLFFSFTSSSCTSFILRAYDKDSCLQYIVLFQRIVGICSTGVIKNRFLPILASEAWIYSAKSATIGLTNASISLMKTITYFCVAIRV
jgi:hypothetical protein